MKFFCSNNLGAHSSATTCKAVNEKLKIHQVLHVPDDHIFNVNSRTVFARSEHLEIYRADDFDSKSSVTVTHTGLKTSKSINLKGSAFEQCRQVHQFFSECGITNLTLAQTICSTHSIDTTLERLGHSIVSKK